MSSANFILKNATIVNEGQIRVCDIHVLNERIERIDSCIEQAHATEIDCSNLFLMPGVIDAHVHFREPGFTHKGSIESESVAAVFGGVTSFIDMPNTVPSTTDVEQLLNKYRIASRESFANYGFFLGVSASNYKSVAELEYQGLLGITDDGLYFEDENSLLCDHLDALEFIFKNSNHLLAIHSENSNVIKRNLYAWKEKYGTLIPFEAHAFIRSADACFQATKEAVALAKKHEARLHILHLTSGLETILFESDANILKKKITTEVCPQNLWFSSKDYQQLGSKIKWNPSIKEEKDRLALLDALNNDCIDLVVTDHAPHALADKAGGYESAISGAPMIQHSLQVMLELVAQGKLTLQKVVEKMCHNPALLYGIQDRGFIREGYFADLTCFSMNSTYIVSKENTHYKCGWSPLMNQTFQSEIIHTFVNGSWVIRNKILHETPKTYPLQRG